MTTSRTTSRTKNRATSRTKNHATSRTTSRPASRTTSPAPIPAPPIPAPPSDPLAEAVRALSERDPRLAELIAKVGPCRLVVSTGAHLALEHFAGLVSAIVSQQLSSKAASTIFGRVKELAGDPGIFPHPEALYAVPEEKLRAAGLSRAKAASVRDLCERVMRGEIKLEALDAMDNDAVIEALCAVKGIGRWTAEMFRLGRADVLPVADLGIQKGIQRLFGLRNKPTPERMHALTKHWRPYRSIGCWYLWRLNDIALAGAAEAKRST